VTRSQNITLAEMREMGGRDDIEHRFTCTVCGKRAADVRPDLPGIVRPSVHSARADPIELAQASSCSDIAFASSRTIGSVIMDP
jgi:hypothetical protein